MRTARFRHFPPRGLLVLALMLAGYLIMAGRAVWLHVFAADHLQSEGDARHLRVIKDDSTRGMIIDRNGEPLALSSPVDSVWANPSEFAGARARWPEVAQLLGVNVRELATITRKHAARDFMYVRRHIPPELANQLRALHIPGVGFTREYRRFYPGGEVTGHVLGFTNLDGRGQEGVELAYEKWLRTTPGKTRVLQNRRGEVVERVESVRLPRPGHDLALSIDRRLQYLTWRELRSTMDKHGARAATAIVLDIRSGEVLALVNEPGFNPNNPGDRKSDAFRNRAATDVFEPGSTIKPFTVAAALDAGVATAETLIDTSGGQMKVSNHTVRDVHPHGFLTVAQVLEKSSNVGAARLAMRTGRGRLHAMLKRAGFGQRTGIELPGEVPGVLSRAERWGPVEQATISYGYGISVTALQLAHAYQAIANDGEQTPLTLLRRERDVTGTRVMSREAAKAVRAMLEMATGSGGTGGLARLDHYRVAGKTGTAHKVGARGYQADSYLASFVGFAPASRPRLAMVVLVDEPVGLYYGGQVAAPVFARVIGEAARLMNIPPDQIPTRMPGQIQKGDPLPGERTAGRGGQRRA